MQRGRTNRSQAGDCARTDLIAPVRRHRGQQVGRPRRMVRIFSTAHRLTDRMPIQSAQLQTDRKTFVSPSVTRE